MSEPTLPLQGVRVAALTIVWAGPYATALLSDLGAEIIRMESPNYSPYLTRGATPRPSQAYLDALSGWSGAMPDRKVGERPWNRWPLFNAHARNKLGMTVDLTQPSGQEVAHRLLQASDVFIENNVPETLEKLQLTYEQVSEVNPGIVMISMPAFGTTGPYKNYRALGVNNEGVAGHNSLRGYTDMDASALSPVFSADAAAGASAAFAAMAALHHRRRTGQGQYIEVSQTENFLPYLGEYFMDYFMNGRVGETMGNRQPHALQGCYPCLGDDKWINISIFDEAEWQGFCRVMEHPTWTTEPEFATHEDRRRYHDVLDTHIAEWTLQHDAHTVMGLLQGAGVPAGAVLDQADAFADPHLEARGFFQSAYQEDCGTHLYPSAPFRMSVTDPKIRTGPVRLGGDNEYVYKTVLGYSDGEYEALAAEGHITMEYPPHSLR